MRRQLELASKPNASGLRTFAAFIGPRQDQMTLKLRKTAKHLITHGIAPRIIQRFEHC